MISIPARCRALTKSLNSSKQAKGSRRELYAVCGAKKRHWLITPIVPEPFRRALFIKLKNRQQLYRGDSQIQQMRNFHCLRSRNHVNVIIAGKQPALQWLDMPAAIRHCTTGIGIWDWASNDENAEPDVVMASAGDVPTLESLAAVDLLRQHFPDIRIRFVNVVDLMTLQPSSEHPHGLTDRDFDSLFTVDKPIIFAYHGYPWLIHRLTYRRTNHDNMHVRGYKEEGTTTTPFDMAVQNDLDRFHLAGDVVDRVPRFQRMGAYFKQFLRDKLVDHKQYVDAHGDDMPEIKNWKWPY